MPPPSHLPKAVWSFLFLVPLIASGRPVTAQDLNATAAPTAETPLSDSAGASAAAIEIFEKKIRPLLLDRCVSCHGESKQEGGLRLDSPEAIAKGGDSGSIFVAGDASASLIVLAVKRLEANLEMPPDKKDALPPDEVAIIESWVQSGAAMPVAVPTSSRKANREIPSAHWSFQPISRPAVPSLPEGAGSAENAIDLFVLERLAEKGLSQTKLAEKSSLIRRVTFDLTGLPPTEAEVKSFLEDDSPNAYEKVVDRLLASPQYGVAWGRHWLDVVRYADSNGLDENIAHGNAWRYRNFVIQSWNDDRPYDQFIRQQLAGDLLEAADEQSRNENRIATGFLVMGPKVLAEVDERKMEMDIVDEQIDTIGKSMLGLTLGCARCHDHKFDPISTEDYYAMAGIFKSTRTMESFTKIAKWNENPIDTEADRQLKAKSDQDISATQSEIEKLRSGEVARLTSMLKEGEKLPDDPEPMFSDAVKTQLAQVRAKLAEQQKVAFELPTAMGVADGTPNDVPVHIRGNHLALGKSVNRRTPAMFVATRSPSFSSKFSGRRELAEWMVQEDHPLTARVLANRLWRWHFGKGIVASTDNFGILGEEPTHPRLLDWLASELIGQGWSIKHIQRLIVMSHTYRLSDGMSSQAIEIDPENRLYWKASTRRIEAESIRDSILMVSGLLDLSRGSSLLHVKNREFLFDHTSIDKTKYDSHLRSVYLPVIRNHLFDLFDLFDYTDAANVNGNRDSTIVAPQALFILNSGIVIDSAKKLASDIVSQGGDRRQMLDRLFLRLYARYPTADEIAVVEQDLLGGASGDIKVSLERWEKLCLAMLATNEFIYVR